MVGPRLSNSLNSEASPIAGSESSVRRISRDDRAFAGGGRAFGARIADARREATGHDGHDEISLENQAEAASALGDRAQNSSQRSSGSRRSWPVGTRRSVSCSPR